MARERNIHDILEDNVDKLRERVDDVRERAEEVAEKAREKGEEVWKKSEEAWKDAAKFTQKHPAQALGLAAVIGAALGVLLFGGRRRD